MTHSTPYPRVPGGRRFPWPRASARRAAGMILLMGLLAGCAGPVELTKLDELPCPGCRNTLDIHTESFLRLAADARGSCVVHRYWEKKEGEKDLPEYWRPMLAPLARLLRDSRVHLHLWKGKTPGARERNIARARALRALYREVGARAPKGSLHGDPRLFLPPYRGLCRTESVDGPMLELGEHARFLSGQAAPPMAKDAAADEIMNTLIVIIHPES
uniref:Uncharacterized protein n=1 Tax=Candidatus Kentrum sp. FM TaxID=2126340 RepID=A0A450S9C5_9GAMM|nr:MAG: hypothetical protein BECKFM1743A_GA0114220_1004511 [Candidatus Kentron sp. FM]VFJ48602.1 MAG: hypothetical protein BECKFM1743C_GA0114222_1006110 [Candidatus Kentron sp. FM]VFK08060.1 MAG: hypothetical protein BECKFM1743B_GA0114221_100589 [Candidatus Kentron sp. FM]